MKTFLRNNHCPARPSPTEHRSGGCVGLAVVDVSYHSISVIANSNIAIGLFDRLMSVVWFFIIRQTLSYSTKVKKIKGGRKLSGINCWGRHHVF